MGIPEASNQNDAVAGVRAWLERHHRWLLILDNVEAHEPLEQLLPRSGGPVLLTTQRDDDWDPLGQRILVDVLEPPEAAAFLQARSHKDDQEAAEQVVEALGRLPLALEQAGAFLAQSKVITLARYAELFEQQSVKLLARGHQPSGYAHTVDTTWELALGQLRHQTPGAIELLNLTAFLGPEDLPVQLLVTHADLLPTSLATEVGNWLDLAELTGALGRYSLVKVEHDGLFVHRLLQAIIRSDLNQAAQQTWASAAVWLLQATFSDHERTGAPGRTVGGFYLMPWRPLSTLRRSASSQRLQPGCSTASRGMPPAGRSTRTLKTTWREHYPWPRPPREPSPGSLP